MSSVAVVTWPINDVGGINSWCKNFVSALTCLGVENRTFYSSPQGRFECYPDRELHKKRCSILKASHLSYRPDLVGGSLHELNRHDLIVFLHPSPHPTRANAGPHERDWQRLYRDTRPPKLVVFHDANWRKTNGWFAEVKDHVDAIVAAQRLFIHSVNEYPADCPKRWSYFPLDMTLARATRDKARRVEKNGLILATQWLKWKNHHKFLPQMFRINHPVSVFGNGQEYHTLRLGGVFQSAFDKDHTTGETLQGRPGREFFGYVPYEKVMECTAACAASIDLSTKGYTNMTHWEPLTVGTVSMIERRVAEHPDNMIPEDCSFTYDLGDAAEDVNRLLSPEYRAEREKIVARANKFIACSGNVRVTRDILDWLSTNKVVNIKVNV